MNKPLRIGLFGGSFDPIHSAHCAIAQAALEQAALDKVVFIVAPRPPHKDDEGAGFPMAAPEDRYAMVCAAVRGRPGMEASRIELDRPGKSYTIDTLREFQQLYPGAELFLILGMDSLIDLPKWKDPHGILECAHILAVPRPDLRQEPAPEMAGKYTILDFCTNPVSSTEIRERIAAGAPWQHLVPPSVSEVIIARGLYDTAR